MYNVNNVQFTDFPQKLTPMYNIKAKGKSEENNRKQVATTSCVNTIELGSILRVLTAYFPASFFEMLENDSIKTIANSLLYRVTCAVH